MTKRQKRIEAYLAKHATCLIRMTILQIACSLKIKAGLVMGDLVALERGGYVRRIDGKGTIYWTTRRRA